MINENLNFNNIEDEEPGFDFKTILMKLFIYWKWILLSIVVSLGCAYVYLQMQTPVYRVSGRIMIHDKQKGGYQDQMTSLQQDFGIMASNGGLDNEIEIMHSKSMLKRVVLDLGMYTTYKVEEGFFKPARVLYKSYPVNAEISKEDAEKMPYGLSIKVTQPNPTTYIVEYPLYNKETKTTEQVEKELHELPYQLETRIGVITLTKGTAAPLTKGQEMTISFTPPLSRAAASLGALSIQPTSKSTAIATVSYLDVNTRRGVDFINQLLVVYNRENNNDKNQVALKTEEFVRKRLEIVARELDEAEEQIAQFKRSLGVVDVGGDAQKSIQGTSTYETRSLEINTQLQLLSYLQEYINEPENQLQTMPTNVGLADASLSGLIGRYNEIAMERDRLLRTASESNPAVVDLTLTLNTMISSIETSIESLRKSLLIQKRVADSQTNMYTSKLGDVPNQEKILAAYQRQLEVKSGLYMMLLQKSEENAIALAATSDNAKMIDAPSPNYSPVSPKRSSILLIALVAGCAVPIVIIYLLELLRYKLEGRNDLERLTKVPILGDVIMSHELKGRRCLVVRENDNDVMAETFRSIRTNLHFLLEGPDKKVIQFTSSTSGEGKTFVSSNLAMSMALLGKKVLLVGLDIRKPRLAEIFDIKDRKKGITAFLVGDKEDKELLFSQIMPSGVNANLDVLPAGVVPPNPAELLSRENLDYAIKFLSEVYDYIILDTAPVALVADTLIIARVADASVYICRSDYTAKSALKLVNSLYAENKLRNMSIVLNGVDMRKPKYEYYYGAKGYGRYGYGRYGYGRYGYGRYGYGRYTQYGYSENLTKKS